MKKRPVSIRKGNLLRSSQWNGVRTGDAVVVDGAKERRQHWVFVAYVVNEATGDEWVEVRGGRVGEAKGRSFRPEVIYPGNAKRGSRLVGLSLADAPQLPIAL
ncbi:MAG TPA: hypothetical protein VMV96_00160 [Acidimicrobiales bacterium]|nr:hypothetical protein [Acidimicrobiales bacterium]